MPDVSRIKDLPLKAIFCIHFIFTIFSTIGSWAPTAYLFYNFLLLILILWSLQNKESEDPVQLAFSINVISIILDVFVLALWFPDSHNGAARFSAAMGILLLIVRPFTTVYIMHMLRERLGNPGHNESYEDIDRSAAGNTRSEYDFNNAQQL
ncbi:PREDICTED: type-1 angiotensin II receptor-associated protein isoform X2 [Nicrophorus vespilloides]|uniref:Type-1 angiotensin II receptor-associated protein isoform X2 n=1 Tax=Nicrophorus vespilloides TaxID=110193 RepID=A0ABM1N774_NICVS|nr:PREDICTED: type-1 angiotensin II receptor-associated protein isoform X2 [Nicrophorus vespilloides]